MRGLSTMRAALGLAAIASAAFSLDGLDRLAGGVGVRRGRRDPKHLFVGESLDFWRVEERVPGQLLRLRADPDAFALKLAGIAERHGVLRMKGFLAVAGKPMRLLVQGVGSRVRQGFDRAWRPGEERRGRLVVIGEKGIDRAGIAVDIGA